MQAAIRLYGCNTRGPSYKRFVFYHLPRRTHVSSAPTSSVLYFKNYRSTAMLLLFPALLRSDPCSDLSYSLGGYYGARRFESTENRLERRGDVFLQHAFKSALLCVIKVVRSDGIEERMRIAKRVSPIRELSCKDRKGRSAG